MKYHIETFGCQMNEYDSQLITGVLQAAGYEKVSAPQDAQLVVVNTCCVRESAEAKIYSYLGSLKKQRQRHPAFTVAVCGCLVQKAGAAKRLAGIGGYVGVLAGSFTLGNLPAYLEEHFSTGQTVVAIGEGSANSDPAFLPNRLLRGESTFRAQISVIYGCDNFCSYCIVPYVRGRERSRDKDLILQEAAQLAQDGCKEILLLGQNVNSYGKDLPDGGDFAGLLRDLARIDGLERIRYITSHPKDFSVRILEAMLGEEKICRHFHLPLQSGCDKILQKMNRGYDTEYYRRLLTAIRAVFPEAVITTDLIVGFPGETGDDFARTCDFVRECQFDAAYTFIFSPRSGTPAAEMTSQVPTAEKKQRLQEIMKIQNPVSWHLNQKMLGREISVLVEGESKNKKDFYFGRSDGNKIVIFPAPPDAAQLTGTMTKIKINRANTWNLYGELVP
ncbi:MAG: tRNA (N6-isopentenyl adenosine(37)-C2)-methylthiotransferase MiaB [Clostridiales bacterium]|nr:tRNA (N6-isopentenyl adenosine(37)-C2)-methylthiotransferase MiaB [Clostridiales bacterium]